VTRPSPPRFVPTAKDFAYSRLISYAALQWPGYRDAPHHRLIARKLEADDLLVEGERRRRYAVCFNPQEAQRQKSHREELLQELDAELASLRDSAEGHSKRVCALRTSARYGRFLKETKTGLTIDTAAIREVERFDGKFVVHSNDDTLTAEDMALGYKQLQRVEESWRTMKSGLRMRPVFHWAPHRIHAHIALSVLALLLERTIEYACQDTWRNIRDDLKHLQLAQLSSPHGTVWQVTDPTPNASKRLKSLNIKPPAPIQGVA
jgi:transposase